MDFMSYFLQAIHHAANMLNHGCVTCFFKISFFLHNEHRSENGFDGLKL